MIGVLVSGEGTNLQALLDAGLPVVAVASNVAGARALDRAAAAGVPAAVFDAREHESREARDVALAEWLRSRGVDLVVCAGYMHLFREPFFDYYGGRIVNTHSAPLPAFPGAHPIEDVLAAGVSTTAATVHYVDEGVDTGPVIASEHVPVLPGDTVESLRARVQAVEHRLLPQVVGDLVRERRGQGEREDEGGTGPAPTSVHEADASSREATAQDMGGARPAHTATRVTAAGGEL